MNADPEEECLICLTKVQIEILTIRAAVAVVEIDNVSFACVESALLVKGMIVEKVDDFPWALRFKILNRT